MASALQIDKHRSDRGPVPAAASSPLLTAEDVAAITGLSVETLAQWRSQRKGIPFLKLSRNVVRYQQGDLDAWLAERIVRVAADPSNAERRL
jgi:predicted DNA-binding transcriptional regulator AlpA